MQYNEHSKKKRDKANINVHSIEDASNNPKAIL